MVMELKSLTPLAEFMDVIYSRCATELSSIAGLQWWIELRPPTSTAEGTGVIFIKGVFDRSLISATCIFDAVTEGVQGIGVEEMTIVADYHIANFKSMVTS